MIDYLICEYPLPIPEEAKKDILLCPKWDEIEFHTKSFPTNEDLLFFDKYTISEDGQLYKELIEREGYDDEGLDFKESSVGIELQEYTGEIIFSGIHLDRDYDFIFEFLALYWKGELKEFSLQNWEKQKNFKRKELQRKIKESVKEIQKRQEKPWNFLYRCYYYIINVIFGVLKTILLSLMRLLWWIESKIT